MRHYCTYFDHRYLSKGLAMGRSLEQHATGSVLWVLCLDDLCYEAMLKLAEPAWVLVRLSEFEQDDAELLAVKETRSTLEYYYTCTPSLVRYVQKRVGPDDSVTYLDSDLWFFSSPECVYTEMGENSVAITPHRFCDALKHLEIFGRYNVGWLTFKNDECGRACAGWWRESCLEWCYDRAEPGRMGDQAYLDRFSELFGRVHDVQHLGVNFAPWNMSGHEIERTAQGVLIDRAFPLVVFHFHGLRKIGPRRFMTQQKEYGCPLDSKIRRFIYEPYLVEVLRAEADSAPFVGGRAALPIQRVAAFDSGGMLGLVRSLKRQAKIFLAGLNGQIIHMR